MFLNKWIDTEQSWGCVWCVAQVCSQVLGGGCQPRCLIGSLAQFHWCLPASIKSFFVFFNMQMCLACLYSEEMQISLLYVWENSYISQTLEISAFYPTLWRTLNLLQWISQRRTRLCISNLVEIQPLALSVFCVPVVCSCCTDIIFLMCVCLHVCVRMLVCVYMLVCKCASACALVCVCAHVWALVCERVSVCVPEFIAEHRWTSAGSPTSRFCPIRQHHCPLLYTPLQWRPAEPAWAHTNTHQPTSSDSHENTTIQQHLNPMFQLSLDASNTWLFARRDWNLVHY